MGHVITVLLVLVLVVVAGGAGFAISFFFLGKRRGTEAEAKEARASLVLQEAETTAKEKMLEAKEEAHKIRAAAQQEAKEARVELQQSERRLQQKEETLERRLDDMERRQAQLENRERELAEIRAEAQRAQQQQLAELQRVAALSRQEAEQIVLTRVESELKAEVAKRVRQADSEIREESDRRARRIVSEVIQRVASDQTAESSVSVLPLPSDDMKGRIIGREGRNIRALQAATGIDIIVDDTPEAIIISGFDPIRREVARVALNKLIVDGRIHPAKIEETVAKAQQEVQQRIKEEGEAAYFEVGLQVLHPEIIKTMGALKFRTSYGQNVLNHSKEVAFLAGMIASEIRSDVTLAKQCGFLHDIGKALSHEVEGPHAVIGADLLAKYGVSEAAVHAVRAHHYDVEPNSVEAVILIAADAISAARPGARRETLEAYIKRLEKLEEIANSFEGVETSYAIQAGREVRIIVKPDRVDDAYATVMAHDIVKRIEGEMTFPGQIKVTVVRVTRAIDYGK